MCHIWQPPPTTTIPRTGGGWSILICKALSIGADRNVSFGSDLKLQLYLIYQNVSTVRILRMSHKMVIEKYILYMYMPFPLFILFLIRFVELAPQYYFSNLPASETKAILQEVIHHLSPISTTDKEQNLNSEGKEYEKFPETTEQRCIIQ